ncbi:MAG: 16S rRNA (guanine(966)-N(2))-methyltransferase RsmD [Gammaproteobacteria bacterium]|nr:16S rRNA (guanine(966)-N(2))-methyltransferase RsmD [Gammaproteobacteria bacterium]
MKVSKVRSVSRNQLRIIGGQWRGRKLVFPDVYGLRPTTDRVRETLFNWLNPVICGSRCLDLFAGSGALGLEALSRGAAHVVMVDRQPCVIEQLKKHVIQLEAQGAYCIQADGLSFLTESNESYNIVFLDPPFQDDLLKDCIQMLQKKSTLVTGAQVYIEHDNKKMLPETPSNWQLSRSKKAGQVGYHLFKVL